MDRPPLDPTAVHRLLRTSWQVQVVPSTASTNADLVAAAARTPSGTVLVAEHQSSGRGRLDRSWTSPPRAGLTFSLLVRPATPTATWGWLPLLAGVALREAIGVGVVLKWPNDLLAGPARRKAAGILAQVAGDAVVVGVGLNVTTTAEELPVDTATSLLLEGEAVTDRAVLLGAFLDAFAGQFGRWSSAGGDAEACGLAESYRDACSTVGEQVSVCGTDGGTVGGVAVGIDPDGRLLVESGGTRHAIAAGDVLHVRPPSG